MRGERREEDRERQGGERKEVDTEREKRKTGVRGERQSERKEKGVRGEKRGRVRG